MVDLRLVWTIVVVAGGCYLLARGIQLTAKVRRLRLDRLSLRKRFEALPLDPPLGDANSKAIARGEQNIDKQFSVTRRALVPLITSITVLLASVPYLTITSAPIASVVGAVGAVILGVALRPVLENAVAGLVIGASRVIRIGDTVRIDEMYGTVEDITSTYTAIKVWDWRRYLVPNSRMLQSSLFNHSLFDSFEWAHCEFSVAPDTDLALVEELAIEVAANCEANSLREPPSFWIMRIEKDAIWCWLAAWAESPSEAWALRHEMRTGVVKALQTRGINLSRQHLDLGGAPRSESPHDLPKGQDGR